MSATSDIKETNMDFKAFSLKEFTGDFSDLATNDIKYIKVVDDQFTLPPKLKTDLLHKVMKTESEIFKQI